MRLLFREEAKVKGMVGKDIGEFVKTKVDALKEEFISANQTTFIEKRTQELEALIPEAIKRSKKLENLQACSDDAKRMIRFLIETMGGKPEHIILMMMEPVFNKVIQVVKVGKEETKDTRDYYFDAKDEAQINQWLTKPERNVPENMLPAIKSSYLCYSHGIRDELMTSLSQRTVQSKARRNPTLDNYKSALQDFVDKAKANPKKKYLFIQFFASHGYHVDGFQQVATPYFNPETESVYLIPVEQLVRAAFTGLANAYCLVHFACCREIKQLTVVKTLNQNLDDQEHTRGNTVS